MLQHATMKNDGINNWFVSASKEMVFVINEHGFGYVTPNASHNQDINLDDVWDDFNKFWLSIPSTASMQWFRMK